MSDIQGNYAPEAGLQEIAHQDFLSIEERVDEGFLNPMEAYSMLYNQKKLFDQVLNRVKEMAIEERQKYGEKEELVYQGYDVQLSGRTNYSYKHDEEWQGLEASKKERESLMKKSLSMNEQNKQLVVHGEVIPPAEASFTTSIKMVKK
ncbi:MAG: hypothetical protein RIE52_12130 [Balneola sp.]